MAQQMYILSLAVDGEEDENTGAYSVVDDLGNETIFLFEEDEDAERYSASSSSSKRKMVSLPRSSTTE